jgi:hypothetical protein
MKNKMEVWLSEYFVCGVTANDFNIFSSCWERYENVVSEDFKVI